MLYLIEQIKRGSGRGPIEAVNAERVLDPPQGLDRLFREFHSSGRWMIDKSYKAGTNRDQNGPARGSPEQIVYS